MQHNYCGFPLRLQRRLSQGYLRVCFLLGNSLRSQLQWCFSIYFWIDQSHVEKSYLWKVKRNILGQMGININELTMLKPMLHISILKKNLSIYHASQLVTSQQRFWSHTYVIHDPPWIPWCSWIVGWCKAAVDDLIAEPGKTQILVKPCVRWKRRWKLKIETVVAKRNMET